MKTAKLPVELRAETPRCVSELAIGESGYVGISGLIVTPDQDCFLDAKNSLEKPGLLQMMVRREQDGFHVVLPSAPEFMTQPLLKGMDVFADRVNCHFERQMVSGAGGAAVKRAHPQLAEGFSALSTKSDSPGPFPG